MTALRFRLSGLCSWAAGFLQINRGQAGRLLSIFAETHGGTRAYLICFFTARQVSSMSFCISLLRRNTVRSIKKCH